jgi:hypothetical protein
MITFLTAFKPFNSVYRPIQRSALFSYKANGVPVVAVDTEGDADKYCSRFPNVTLFKNTRTGLDLGFKNRSPVLKDLLVEGLKLIQTPFVGLINADILIPMGFKNSIQEMITKAGDQSFIAFTRYDLLLLKEVKTVLELKRLFSKQSAVYDEASSSDLFVSSKKNFIDIAGEIPDFILGRYGWDNWIHSYSAVNFKCFNGTKALKILHCRHDHSHIVNQEGKPGRSAASSAHNISLLESIQEQYGPMVRINTWEEI